MADRFFASGRFGYSMGHKSREAAQDTFDSLCAEGDLFPSEGKIEPYNVGPSPQQRVTRYAITID